MCVVETTDFKNFTTIVQTGMFQLQFKYQFVVVSFYGGAKVTG